MLLLCAHKHNVTPISSLPIELLRMILEFLWAPLWLKETITRPSCTSCSPNAATICVGDSGTYCVPPLIFFSSILVFSCWSPSSLFSSCITLYIFFFPPSHDVLYFFPPTKVYTSPMRQTTRSGKRGGHARGPIASRRHPPRATSSSASALPLILENLSPQRAKKIMMTPHRDASVWTGEGRDGVSMVTKLMGGFTMATSSTKSIPRPFLDGRMGTC